MRTTEAATNLCIDLIASGRFSEARTILRKQYPLAKALTGKNATVCSQIPVIFGLATDMDPEATGADVAEATTMLEDALPFSKRVFGPTHPITQRVVSHIKRIKSKAAGLATDSKPRG